MTAGSLNFGRKGRSRWVRREIEGPMRSRVLSEAQCKLIAIDGASKDFGGVKRAYGSGGRCVCGAVVECGRGDIGGGGCERKGKIAGEFFEK